MDDLNDQINWLADKIYDELVLLRHTIHEQPELSSQEYKTAELVETVLNKWNIDYIRLSHSTAIIAKIKGNLDGNNCIGIRADMDALPIHEETGLNYASQVPGVMHACGHDIHIVNLLGTGYILSQLKNNFAGTVKLVFQPAEEIGGGAAEIIDYGVLENPQVTAFLAGHVAEEIKVGQVQVKAEEIMLASSRFDIKLSGRGGHASAPHRTDDIILAAAKLILELQCIPSRKINHIEPAVITVSSIHAGSRSNIMPQELVLTGTIRTQNNDLRREIHTYINDILTAQEIISGVQGGAVFKMGSGAVYNEPLLTAEFVSAAANIIGKHNVLLAKLPNNGSENFYHFAKRVPAVFFRLGVNPDPGQNREPLHSSKFIAADEALKTGVRVMTAAALAFLRKGPAMG